MGRLGARFRFSQESHRSAAAASYSLDKSRYGNATFSAAPALRGRLKRSAREVQPFRRLAVLETHTLRYYGPLEGIVVTRSGGFEF